MTKLQELEPLDPKRHNPFVGPRFGQSQFGRLLIVGLSHYGDEKETQEPNFTQKIINEVIAGRSISYFTKIAHLFRNSDGNPFSPAEFYPLVAFYNFLPDHFSYPKQPPTHEQYHAPETQQFFRKVLKELKPDRVLITGKRLWQILPSRNPPFEPKPAYDLKAPLTGSLHPDQKHAWWHVTDDGEYALVAPIYHPSSPAFNANKAEAEKWIPLFLKFVSTPTKNRD